MYSTDELMFSLNRCLRTDLHNAAGLTDVSPGRFSSFRTIEEMRAYSVLLHDGMTPYQYKIGAQINSFLKRYTFQKDVLSPAEREEATNEKFLALQSSLATNYWRPRSVCLHEVIRRARSICRRILAGYSPQGCDPRGQFGTKATVGCPASRAYIDEKLLKRPITGSEDHIDWAKRSLVSGDPILKRILKEKKSKKYECVSTLAQVNVPKKYNIDRGINPNTLLGSYYSSALGRIVQQALKDAGLDIVKLQHIHGILARRASTKGRLATADLSNASHGFLSNLINALMPREWYRAIMRGVIRSVDVSGRVYRLESIMTMGIGFTFPVQTLLFYCLLCALSDLTGVEGTISVYGDDLIYPVPLHKYVAKIFPALGFSMNLDKTFVNSPFKESCGSDFFRGVDVRPYSPEGSYQNLGKHAYVAFCYKILNGLLRRWDQCEVPSTVRLLKFEIVRLMGSLFAVPRDFPDHSGWKIAKNCWEPIHGETSWWIFPIKPWRLHTAGNGSQHHFWSFDYLNKTTARHEVLSSSPYYWEKLRTYACAVIDHYCREAQRASRVGGYTPYREYVVPICNLPLIVGTQLLKHKVKERRMKDKDGKVVKTRYVSTTTPQKSGGSCKTWYKVTSSQESLIPKE